MLPHTILVFFPKCSSTPLTCIYIFWRFLCSCLSLKVYTFQLLNLYFVQTDCILWHYVHLILYILYANAHKNRHYTIGGVQKSFWEGYQIEYYLNIGRNGFQKRREARKQSIILWKGNKPSNRGKLRMLFLLIERGRNLCNGKVRKSPIIL